MLYKFTKTKPPYKKLWEDIQETFQKPLYGYSLDVVQFTMLYYISTGAFNVAKTLMKSDITEEEFSPLNRMYPHTLLPIEEKFQDYIPNPEDMPLKQLLSLVNSNNASGYLDIIGPNALENVDLTKCFYNDRYSITNLLANSNSLFDHLQDYFTFNKELPTLTVPSQIELEAQLLDMCLNGKREIPPFMYITVDVANDTLTNEETEDASNTRRYLFIKENMNSVGVETCFVEGKTVSVSGELWDKVKDFKWNNAGDELDDNSCYDILTYSKISGTVEIRSNKSGDDWGCEFDASPLVLRYKKLDTVPTAPTDWLSRSIRVSGDRGEIGYIDYSHNVEGDINYKRLTKKQYEKLEGMHCNSNDDISVKPCTVLNYAKHSGKLLIMHINTPNFSVDSHIIILRYKEQN